MPWVAVTLQGEREYPLQEIIIGHLPNKWFRGRAHTDRLPRSAATLKLRPSAQSCRRFLALSPNKMPLFW